MGERATMASGGRGNRQVDPITGAVQARIPIHSPPTWTFGGAGMAVGDGSLWITGAGERGAIDPETNSVVDVIALGGRVGGDVTVDPTGVWVVIFRGGPSLSVVRVDPSLDRVVARIPLAGEWSNQVFASAGLIWTTSHVPLLVFEKYGPAKANFIHVEEFLPGKDLQPPPATAENLSPAFKAWGFQNEPWVIVVDRTGIIQGRLGPGVTAAPLIEAALEPLL